MANLTNLPLDILVLIFPYLDARSFLSLCSTCKALHNDSISLDASYWRHATRSKFRVRNIPVVANDGLLWRRLYRRMFTQSRVFTWGQNTRGCLGHSSDEREEPPLSGPLRRRAEPYPILKNASWPKEIEYPEELGLVADLQCGGWSTCVLNDKGDLFVVGELNGEVRRVGHAGVKFRRLKFPAGFNNNGVHEYTTIRQFSTGRLHILALSDSGRIWRWLDEVQAGFCMRFNNLEYFEDGPDLKPNDKTDSLGRVRSVVAGWNKSSAYITGTGIIYWDVPPLQQQENQYMEDDSIIIQEWVTVPHTSYVRPRGSQREPDETARQMGMEVGEVTNWIVLEHILVFITDIGKVFAAPFHWDFDTGVIHDSIELKELQAHSADDPTPSVTDIQGSFRSFAVFKKNGEVLITDLEYLYAALENATAVQPKDLPEPRRIPALQNSGVIQIAFGDYHYLALHSSGKITSYGTEPHYCGALGLGGWIQEGFGRRPPETSSKMMEGSLRGLWSEPQSQDRKLLPHAYLGTGREVWFQSQTRAWLEGLARGVDPEVGRERVEAIATNLEIRGEVSEWVEQRGRNWDIEGKDGLGAYFSLSVAAAGWHSGSLVLVNDELAQRITTADRFPNLALGKRSEVPPQWNLTYDPSSSNEVFGARGWRWTK